VEGIVISGTIDGFTREVVALDAYTSNTASNVLNSIVTAFTRKGIPRLLRADAGSENIAIGKFMYLVRGEDLH
jgi:transposase InsO family protein